MNRRILGLALFVAAGSLAILLLLLRGRSTPPDDRAVGRVASGIKQQPSAPQLPEGLRGDPAQPMPDGRPRHLRGQPGYDAAKAETIRGRIAASDSMQDRLRQDGEPERIILESAGEQIIVRLGPRRGLRD